MNILSKLLLLCFLILSQSSHAAVKETLDYKYYTAQADSSLSLRAILNAATPIREDGESFHGYTKWYVKWRFWWFEKPDGRCKITKVDTSLTATITLPDLVGAESQQQNRFDTFISALKVHELGHYDIGKQVANLIDEKILALPEMSSCKALESTANRNGHQTLDEYRAMERQYDKTTTHGKTQGAWLE